MATAMASEITSTGRAWYAITLKAEENEAEIRIYEDIGFFGVSAKQFADDLEQLNVQTIHLRLNTYGGEIFDGIAIYNSLRAHPAKIVVHVDGIAASAGSVIAMSGDEIRMADNAYLMIHEARGGVMGEADEMRKYADILDKLNDSIAMTYQGRAKKTRRYWRQKMAEETWYTAEEAKAEGLTDQIEEREKAATNRFDFKIYNQVQHVPEAVLKAWGKPQNNAPEDSLRSEPPPAVTQQEPIMAETATAPSAQNPAAGPGEIQQGTSAADAHKAEMDRIKGLTAEAQWEHGRAEGFQAGGDDREQKIMARFNAIMAACPGDYKMLAEAFLAKQTPEAVKLAFDSANAVASAAAERERIKDQEIARLRLVAATGGYPGGLNLGASGGVVDDPTEPMDPARAKAQAEREWDTQPAVRRTAKTKEIYVLARAAELTGSHRSFTREPANA